MGSRPSDCIFFFFNVFLFCFFPFFSLLLLLTCHFNINLMPYSVSLTFFFNPYDAQASSACSALINLYIYTIWNSVDLALLFLVSFMILNNFHGPRFFSHPSFNLIFMTLTDFRTGVLYNNCYLFNYQKADDQIFSCKFSKQDLSQGQDSSPDSALPATSHKKL